MTNKISDEVAEAMVDEFFEYYDVFPDEATEEEQTAYKMARASFQSAIRRAWLEFKLEGGEMIAVQFLRKPLGENGELTELRYKELNGKAKKAAGKVKNIADMDSRAIATVGVLCGEGEGIILKLKGPDLKLATSLGMFFLLQ